MSPDEFRRQGYRMIDWIADYWQNVEQLPVSAQVQPGDVMAKLPTQPPKIGIGAATQDASTQRDSWDDIFQDVCDVVGPGLMHWQHPSFFGYFPCNTSGPSVLADLLSAGLGVQGMLWNTSPALTEIETRMLDWCAHMYGLPDRFLSTSTAGGGVIQGTASEATLVAMLAARSKLPREKQPLACVYTSAQAHSSIVKAAMIAGIADSPDDRRRLRLIDTDRNLRLDAAALRRAIDQDIANGLAPAFVCAAMGTTSTGAFDPVDDIAAALDGLPHRPWLHVDGAWAGVALVCPEHRDIARGIERSDSLCINTHKWMLTNFDCDLMWTADRAALIGALSITPEYLRNKATEAGEVIDYRDWQIELGRRFRALKLWFVIRHYGTDGLRAFIQSHVDMAAWLEAKLIADDRFEIVQPRSLSLVTFRVAAGDDATREVLDRLNASGSAYCTHTVVPDADGEPRYTIRVAIGATNTEHRHVEALWQQLDRLTAEVLGTLSV